MIMMIKIAVVFAALLFGFSKYVPGQEFIPLDNNQVNIAGGGVFFGKYRDIFRHGAGYSAVAPPIMIFYEQGVMNNINAGPFLSILRDGYDGHPLTLKRTFLKVGGRGTYQLTSLINDVLQSEINSGRMDFYFTAIAGVEYEILRHYSVTLGNGKDGDWRLFLGSVLGARYNFSKLLGIYLEAGRGPHGMFSMGVSASF
jgi:hypothetical protein